MEGGATLIGPSLGGFNQYDTLNTRGAGNQGGREAVNKFCGKKLLNRGSAQIVPRRDVEVGPPGAERGLPEGVD